MFTDSSRCRRLDRVSAGAYAVVFNCYAPGTEYHGCEVAAGWPVGDKKSHGCEGLAIKQAIKVAFTELTTLEQLLPQGPKAKVKVQIFCDNLRLLQELAGLKNYPVEDIDHIASLQRWSQRFRARFTGGNSPFPAKLQLFWVPAHINEVVLHQKADAMVRKVCETQMPLLSVDGEEQLCYHWDTLFQKSYQGPLDDCLQAQPRVAGSTVPTPTAMNMSHASRKTSRKTAARARSTRKLLISTISTTARALSSLNNPTTEVMTANG
ncbi:hypothetical protein SMACR_02025 [Sordaria macrospora]|uniref:WGS project CABT00000000 data, contig 2.18 n=2 Tax=Sordaria macrospora TaxID=5147 RepID=F7W0R6_SORMK|nr:uncharacterized protein SMAC_02025 [Sordaria macrospora k-hell]KAA8624128.1 hypothetical protein SMACR_02025 [Sordaria macrospora]WPJ67321.1 hypothetical protein SMAC4_02025 [Sordaria macrospora]CCC11368.1 unnamed protein product [Sordaria macrospora k-hell]